VGSRIAPTCPSAESILASRSEARPYTSTGVRFTMNGGPNVLGSSVWNGLHQSIPAVVYLLLTPALLDSLGPAGFGLWSLVVTVTVLVTATDGGLGAALLRFATVYPEHRTPLLRIGALLIIAFSVPVAVIGATLASRVAMLLTLPSDLVTEAEVFVRIVALAVPPILLTSLLSALLVARARYRYLTLGALIAGLVLIVPILASPQIRSSIVLVAYAWTASLWMRLIVEVVGCRDALAGMGRPRMARDVRRAYLFFAYRAQVINFLAVFNLQVDALIVAVLLPIEAVGIYGVGANVAYLVRRIPSYALTPLFTRLASELRDTSRTDVLDETGTRAFAELNRSWVVVVSGVVSATALPLAGSLRIWLGPAFAAAGVVALVLLLGHAVNLLGGMYSNLVRLLNRPGIEVRYLAVATAVNLLLTVSLAPLLGVLGVVIATAVGLTVGTIWLVRAARRRFGETLPGLTLGVPALSVLGAVVAGAPVAFAGVTLMPGPSLPAAALMGVSAASLGLFTFIVTLGPERRRSLLRLARSDVTGEQ
jgi:O-antigen/teichoic acid export membrane protein